MQLDSSEIKNILIITLSNIGDCILTLSVIDAIKENFADADLSVIAGPKTEEIFQQNPCINNFIVYNKHIRLQDKLKIVQNLREENFDLVVDLRHTAIPLFLKSKYKTSLFLNIPVGLVHMKDRHLYKLEKTLGFKPSPPTRKSFYISEQDYSYLEGLFKKNNITEKEKLVVVSPGAATHIKRWTPLGFAQISDNLIKIHNVKIILVGDAKDRVIVDEIKRIMRALPVDLCGQTTLRQLGALLKKSQLLICNDSAVMHLASYLNTPIVAIFGSTDEQKYGPWSDKAEIVKKDIFCRPCEKAQCRFQTLACFNLIRPEDVMSAAEKILKSA